MKTMEKELFDRRYKLIRTLSTDGGTADVWLAIDTNTIDTPGLQDDGEESVKDEESGMLVAIKIYRPKNALDIEGEQRFRDEYKIVHNCRHTNLLQPTNFSICDGTPYLELPYCRAGSAERLIGKSLNEKQIWRFVYDVASGLSYLHACDPPIIHQDIKPANVLIDDNGNYAITDFGISAHRGGRAGSYFDDENSGTMAYMAPERFQDDYKPMPESDIWALGATLYEILCGTVPFGEDGGSSQNGNMPAKTINTGIPKSVRKLISSCLALDPKERPDANKIIQMADSRLNGGVVTRYVILSLAVLLSIGTYFIFKPKHIPVEDTYEIAMAYLAGDDAEDMQKGLHIMDSLANIAYPPALYEIARTYGWYSNPELVRRKDMLDIEYYGKDEYGGLYEFLPKEDKYTEKAKVAFGSILESKASIDPWIRADAAYRLAVYYGNITRLYQPNYDQAEKYLLLSKDYAAVAKDTSLMKRIDDVLPKIKEKQKENKKKR